jgi:hypothetical protein
MHTVILIILLAAVIVGIVFLVRRLRKNRDSRIATEVRRQIEQDTVSSPAGKG